MKLNKYSRIILFFIIAIVISNIFRFDVFSLKENMKNLPGWLYILINTFLEGSGVFLGTIIGLKLLSKTKTVSSSFFGSSIKYSLTMAFLPVILFTAIGVKNSFEMNKHLYGFVAGFCTFLYCIIEEYGWRGYLQEELQDLKAWKKYTLIGSIWYIWHLSFLTEADLMSNLMFLLGLILGSWGIGQVMISTKSVTACACFHLIVQIALYNSLIKNGLEGYQKLIIIVACVAFWLIIIKKWEKRNSKIQQNLNESNI